MDASTSEEVRGKRQDLASGAYFAVMKAMLLGSRSDTVRHSMNALRV